MLIASGTLVDDEAHKSDEKKTLGGRSGGGPEWRPIGKTKYSVILVNKSYKFIKLILKQLKVLRRYHFPHFPPIWVDGEWGIWEYSV